MARQTIKLDLKVGYIPSDNKLPLDSTDWSTIKRVFKNSSKLESSQGRIRLSPSPKQHSLAPVPGSVSSIDLHQGLLEITDNDYERRGARSIGVVFAGRYGPKPDALGVMFDRGFATLDDPKGNAFELSLPREGCAVFLDAIRSHLGSRFNAARFRKQVLHTTIHELGHVFNLVHTRESTYMKQTGTAKRPWSSQSGFSEGEQEWLSRWSPDVAPGWRDFRGGYEPAASSDAATKRTAGLSLAARLTRSRMARWDPVELELTLALSSSAKRAASIPDELDPGYPRLAIWITDPSGCRRAFRSPRHYCDSGAQRSLRPGKRIVRDISLFGESGGYTFRTSGRHEIQAIWEPNGPGQIESKTLEIEILKDSHPEARASRALATPQAARALYYRVGSRSSSTFRELEALASAWPDGPNTAHLRYALGRTHTGIARRLTTASAARARRALAAEYLRAATQSKGLGEHARSIAEGLLAELSQEAS